VETDNKDDDDNSDTILCYPPPREEGLPRKGLFRGRRLFQDDQGDGGDALEVPIMLDMAREMGPPLAKKLQHAFQEVSMVPMGVDRRVISGTVWWRASTA
jgi:hypothetical protein